MSDEGIGSRKWSLLRQDDGLYVMEGAQTRIVRAERDDKLLDLVITAPQLWDAANQLMLAMHAKVQNQDAQVRAVRYLENMVAKAVRKTAYTDVLQA